jgi:protein phosphatase
MPWSQKAQELLRLQYAAIGSAGEGLFAAVDAAMEQASAGSGLQLLRKRVQRRAGDIAAYRRAYRAYCWPVQSIEDIRVAPFHILAGRGRSFTDRPHSWHMELATRLAQAGAPCLQATEYILVDPADELSCSMAVDWWLEYTARGGEGMVVKPLDYISRGRKGLLQPALKCRGREYLRIIYGAEYLEAESLALLKNRNVKTKRSLAQREFALGLESLSRFVAGEPLRRVHECAFGVLALESDPVDPRL